MIDALPETVPDPCANPEPGRDPLGRYRAGHPATIEAARQGGRSRRHRTVLAHTIGVPADDPLWATYLRQAEAFRRAELRVLSSKIGRPCGPELAALVMSAALALAGSKFAYARGNPLHGARLALEFRRSLAEARGLAEQDCPRPGSLDALNRRLASLAR